MQKIEELRNNYGQKCAMLGDLVYKQRALHAQAEELIRQIEQLDNEAAKLISEQDKSTSEQNKAQE